MDILIVVTKEILEKERIRQEKLEKDRLTRNKYFDELPEFCAEVTVALLNSMSSDEIKRYAEYIDDRNSYVRYNLSGDIQYLGPGKEWYERIKQHDREFVASLFYPNDRDGVFHKNGSFNNVNSELRIALNATEATMRFYHDNYDILGLEFTINILDV